MRDISNDGWFQIRGSIEQNHDKTFSNWGESGGIYGLITTSGVNSLDISNISVTAYLDAFVGDTTWNCNIRENLYELWLE